MSQRQRLFQQVPKKKKKSINMQRKVIHPHASHVSGVQGTRIFGNHKGIQIAKFLKNILNYITY